MRLHRTAAAVAAAAVCGTLAFGAVGTAQAAPGSSVGGAATARAAAPVPHAAALLKRVRGLGDVGRFSPVTELLTTVLTAPGGKVDHDKLMGLHQAVERALADPAGADGPAPAPGREARPGTERGSKEGGEDRRDREYGKGAQKEDKQQGKGKHQEGKAEGGNQSREHTTEHTSEHRTEHPSEHTSEHGSKQGREGRDEGRQQALKDQGRKDAGTVGPSRRAPSPQQTRALRIAVSDLVEAVSGAGAPRISASAARVVDELVLLLSAAEERPSTLPAPPEEPPSRTQSGNGAGR